MAKESVPTTDEKVALTVIEGDKKRTREDERKKFGPPVWSSLAAAKMAPKDIPFVLQVPGADGKVVAVDCWVRIKRLNDSEKNEWEFAGMETYVKEDRLAESGRQLQVMRDVSGSTVRLFEVSITDFKIAAAFITIEENALDEQGQPIVKKFADYDPVERTKIYSDWLPEQAKYFRDQIEAFNGFSGNEDGVGK